MGSGFNPTGFDNCGPTRRPPWPAIAPRPEPRSPFILRGVQLPIDDDLQTSACSRPYFGRSRASRVRLRSIRRLRSVVRRLGPPKRRTGRRLDIATSCNERGGAMSD